MFAIVLPSLVSIVFKELAPIITFDLIPVDWAEMELLEFDDAKQL